MFGERERHDLHHSWLILKKIVSFCKKKVTLTQVYKYLQAIIKRIKNDEIYVSSPYEICIFLIKSFSISFCFIIYFYHH